MCPDRKNLYNESMSLHVIQVADTQRSTLVVPTDEVNSMGSLTALLGAIFRIQSIRFVLNRRNAKTKLLLCGNGYMNVG